MKSFTIFVLALLIICAMQVNAKDNKDKKDKKTEADGEADGEGEKCKEDCPEELTAVCGYNEKCYHLFDDKCKMEAKNCKDKETFKEVEKEDCEKEDNKKCETE